MTTYELITASLRCLGVIAVGETPSTEDINDALEALQMLLDSWSAQGINVFVSISDHISMTPGKALYTQGPSGDIVSARPNLIKGVFIRDMNEHDYPVAPITEGQYRLLGDKTTAGRPGFYFYKATYPDGSLYLYPVPDTSEDLHIDSIQPWPPIDNLPDTLSFPDDYNRALKFNLAMELATEYGITPSAVLGAQAQEALHVLRVQNFAAQVEPVRFLDMPRGD